MRKKDYIKKIKYTFLNTEQENTRDDAAFRDKTKQQITKRDEKYTELLSHFVWITKGRNVIKEVAKWIFFVIIIILAFQFMEMLTALFKSIITKADIKQIIELIPVLISAIVGGISVVIVIPVTITKYLFSTKEDENITKIILHTQEHDTSGRKWASDDKKEENIDKKIVNDTGDKDIFEELNEKISKCKS